MNKSIKAALLSALVFPGVGHLSIGHKKRGWLFIVASGVFLFLIVRKIIQQTQNIIFDMQQNNAAVNIDEVSNRVSGLITFSDNTYLNILLILFIGGWFLSIIDAYRLEVPKQPFS